MASDSHAKRPIVVERRKEKGRKKTPRLTKTYDVKIIPATVGVVAETEEPPKKRVAAYCRVSTDQEAQETSLEEQMAHFNTVIAEHAIKFSHEESKQTYAISIKVPAIQVEFRRMLPFEDDNGGKLSYTLNGTLYPDEQVVIYDIGDVKPETEKKRRGRRKKSEIEAEQKEN